VRDVFFDDARSKLAGPRPNFANETRVVTDDRNNAKSNAQAVNSGYWSKLIDAETIEAEIKRLGQAVAGDVATASKFKAGAYKDCRRHFSLLAVLFAIAAEHDGDVRWSDVAPALRERFARAGKNCKVGTDQTYHEASQRSDDLAELIRGSRPPTGAVERMADWAQVADRAPLMQRLAMAHDERLTKWLANERQFARYRDEVRHEAQLAAALADVIGREGFEYWDDAEYAQYARQLRQAVSEIAKAAEMENFDQARQAIGRATNTCNSCHEGYRG
jgi:hypothetical protein